MSAQELPNLLNTGLKSSAHCRSCEVRASLAGMNKGLSSGAVSRRLAPGFRNARRTMQLQITTETPCWLREQMPRTCRWDTSVRLCGDCLFS